MLSLPSVVSAFFFLTTMGAFHVIDRTVYGEWDVKAGDKLTYGLHVIFLSACLLLFWWGTRAGRGRFNRVLPLAAAGFLMLSALWSVDASETIKRSGEYLFLILGTIGIVKTLDDDIVMDLIFSTVSL